MVLLVLLLLVPFALPLLFADEDAVDDDDEVDDDEDEDDAAEPLITTLTLVVVDAIPNCICAGIVGF